MRQVIVVLEPEAYDTWYAEQESWLKKHADYELKTQSNEPVARQSTP